jgi:NitT/TauT family transport system substrate-binding protein
MHRLGAASRPVSAFALAFVLVLVACSTGQAPRGAEPAGSAPARAPAGEPAPAPIRITVNSSAANGAQAGLWTAYEAGLFRDEGLEVELTNINSTARVLQAMVAGEVHLSSLDAAATIRASLEGADMVLLFGAANRLIFSVLSQPSLQSPQELRGKILGITLVGSAAYTAGVVALKGWGLLPDRDVSLRQLGEAAAILAGLEAGQIDAGVMSSPTSTRARVAGFRELINLYTEGPDYPSIIIGARRPWVAANEEAVRRFARAYVQGVQRFKNDREAGLAVYRKYLKLDDGPVLEQTYAEFSAGFDPVPYVSEAGLQRLLADLADEEPRLAGRQPAEWIDARYLREVEAASAQR